MCMYAAYDYKHSVKDESSEPVDLCITIKCKPRTKKGSSIKGCMICILVCVHVYVCSI